MRSTKSRWPSGAIALLLTSLSITPSLAAAPCVPDPFTVLDPQNWVNPYDMTWADYIAPPDIDWSDPTRRGSIRNFNIALVTVDYPDTPFVITLPPHTTVFGNPQHTVNGLDRSQVPGFYRDLLNKPSDLNRRHTLHEYWMEDSGGRFGVDLTAFGAYKLPSKSYQYGISNDMNPGECPGGERCNVNIRTDALNAWRADVGNETAAAYELVFILSAGQDESSTWQEFGEMKFNKKEDVPDAFGPPSNPFGNDTNYARTRYVEWTSWVSAASLWPNAGGGSSTQGESSGMGTYAHELSHLLSIGDNYNNPYGVPLRRSYTGPWSMMSRGNFNGPGGPHTRWQIPSLQGGSVGSLHTMRDKKQLGLVDNDKFLSVTRAELANAGVVVTELTARVIFPDEGYMALRVVLPSDLAPACNVNTDVFCDGRGYNNYDVEVVDRMGSDSFQMDAGVMISKTKDQDRQPFQWVVDANPQDIEMVDFVRPNGSVAMITLGDYRQLADALFHAGTRSGSQFEYADEPNLLRFYVISPHRDAAGVLSYMVAVKSLNSTGGAGTYGVTLGEGEVTYKRASTGRYACSFELTNTGSPNGLVPEHLSSDLYRLGATVDGGGWEVVLPNELATAQFGASKWVTVAIGAGEGAVSKATVTLTATSESNPSASAEAVCQVEKM